MRSEEEERLITQNSQQMRRKAESLEKAQRAYEEGLRNYQ